MTRLSVNVNKIATLRNARGKNNPDVVQTAMDIVTFGAHGITVHPRPDGRHIRPEDVYTLSRTLTVEFNIEGYPTPDFIDLVTEVKPQQCTLVPDPPHVLTSNAGWDVKANVALLQKTISTLKSQNIRVSLFIDPFHISDEAINLLAELKTDRVELYTEAYADSYGTNKANEVLTAYKQTANKLNELNIGLNAGHDLNLANLNAFIRAIPFIEEVSIGHALICDALYLGLEETVKRYLTCLQ